MSALDSTTTVPSFKPIINQAVWDAFDYLQNDSIPVKAKLFGFRVNVSIPISSLAPLLILLVGPRQPRPITLAS